jgi:putative transposase
MISNWQEFLDSKDEQGEFDLVRRHERTGRPLGGEGFIESLETRLGRNLGRHKPGP